MRTPILLNLLTTPLNDPAFVHVRTSHVTCFVAEDFPEKVLFKVVQFVEVMSRKIHSQEIPSNNTNRIPSSISLYFHVCLLNFVTAFSSLFQSCGGFSKFARQGEFCVGVVVFQCFRM